MDHNCTETRQLLNCDVSVVDEEAEYVRETDSGFAMMADEQDPLQEAAGVSFAAVVGRLQVELRNTQLRLEEAQEMRRRKDDSLLLQNDQLEEMKREIAELKSEGKELREKLEGERRDHEESLKDKTFKLMKLKELLGEQQMNSDLASENYRLKQLLKENGIDDGHDEAIMEEPVIVTPKVGLAEEGHPRTLRGPVKQGSIPCAMCPAVLKNVWDLKMHSWEQHQLTRVSIPPTTSFRKTLHGVRKSSVKNKTTHVGKKFDCEWCMKQFNTQAQLKSHVETAHIDTYGDGKFTCGKCARTFLARTDLRKHRHVHRMKQK